MCVCVCVSAMSNTFQKHCESTRETTGPFSSRKKFTKMRKCDGLLQIRKDKKIPHLECIYFGNPLVPSSHISLTFIFIYFSKENSLQIFQYCNQSVHTTMNNDHSKFNALQICRAKQSPWGVLWKERVLKL